MWCLVERRVMLNCDIRQTVCKLRCRMPLVICCGGGVSMKYTLFKMRYGDWTATSTHRQMTGCSNGQIKTIDYRCVLYYHYDDVIMSAMASQITSLTIVYSAVYAGADQSKHQSSASLAFVWGIHRGPVNSPHKWPVTWKMFPFDDVIMMHLYTNESDDV